MVRAARRHVLVPWDFIALSAIAGGALLVIVGLGGLLPVDTPEGDAVRILLALLLLGATPLGWKLMKRRVATLTEPPIIADSNSPSPEPPSELVTSV